VEHGEEDEQPDEPDERERPPQPREERGDDADADNEEREHPSPAMTEVPRDPTSEPGHTRSDDWEREIGFVAA